MPFWKLWKPTSFTLEKALEVQTAEVQKYKSLLVYFHMVWTEFIATFFVAINDN